MHIRYSHIRPKHVALELNLVNVASVTQVCLELPDSIKLTTDTSRFINLLKLIYFTSSFDIC